MEIDLDSYSPSAVYQLMVQTLIPRPIAWVLSETRAEKYNLAPFSYFTPVSSDPPLLLISVGLKPDGSAKDTRVNIERRQDFVVHIAHRELLSALNESSATLPPEISEVERLGLATEPWAGSRLPRLRDCRVAYACQCERIIEIGQTPQALILGRVKHIYLQDEVVNQDDKQRLVANAMAIDPLARLGAAEYATLGEVIHLARPK